VKYKRQRKINRTRIAVNNILCYALFSVVSVC